MTTTRSRTIAVLVAAVLVLLASVGAAIAVTASRDRGSADHEQGYVNRYDDTDGGTGNSGMSDPDPGDRGWGGSMMGERGDGYGWMMGPRSSGQAWIDDWPGGWSGDGWSDSKSYGWNGTGPVTAAQAREVAQRWLDRYATSARLGDPVAMPMGYRFLGSQGGTVVAMIMVDDDTGTIFGHLRPTVHR
jgi:hypothetical protein